MRCSRSCSKTHFNVLEGHGFNRAESEWRRGRLQPLRAKDAPQGLKPPPYHPVIGTTEVVPLRGSQRGIATASKSLVAAIVLLACGAALAQESVFHLGRTPTEEEINALDLSIDPSGRGLPPGKGTAKEGAAIYAKKCVQCHGPTGAEGPSLPGAVKLWPYSSARDGYVPPTLAGGKNGMEGIWNSPTATTIWSYIKRAMPPRAEGALSADEVYSLTAWLLFRRGVIQESEIMDAKTLPKAPMPNRACVPWNFGCTEPTGANSGR